MTCFLKSEITTYLNQISTAAAFFEFMKLDRYIVSLFLGLKLRFWMLDPSLMSTDDDTYF